MQSVSFMTLKLFWVLILFLFGRTSGVAFLQRLQTFIAFYAWGVFAKVVCFFLVWSVGHEDPAHINQCGRKKRSRRWLAARCAAITELRGLLPLRPGRAQVHRAPRSVWRGGKPNPLFCSGGFIITFERIKGSQAGTDLLAEMHRRGLKWHRTDLNRSFWNDWRLKFCWWKWGWAVYGGGGHRWSAPWCALSSSAGLRCPKVSVLTRANTHTHTHRWSGHVCVVVLKTSPCEQQSEEHLSSETKTCSAHAELVCRDSPAPLPRLCGLYHVCLNCFKVLRQSQAFLPDRVIYRNQCLPFTLNTLLGGKGCFISLFSVCAKPMAQNEIIMSLFFLKTALFLC